MLGYINSYTKVVEALADQFNKNPYIHIDVGCSGGMHSAIDAFGTNLRATGFDPSVNEIARLNEVEKSSLRKYVAAFVSGVQENTKPTLSRNPWDRLSVSATLRDQKPENDAQKLHLNSWDKTSLADPEAAEFLPEYFSKNSFEYVDFIKIDVDGQDFNILKSVETDLSARSVLGVAIEVNYVGSHLDHEHTFHNVDRFMREQGYDLFGLEVRSYSTAALPFPYLYDFPGNAIKGRPLQGDALYFRDLCAEHSQKFASQLSAPALLKAVAIMSLCNLPDSSAEIVLHFHEKLEEIVCTKTLLNLLAEEVQVLSSHRMGMSFDEYKDAFARSDDYFWPNVKK